MRECVHAYARVRYGRWLESMTMSVFTDPHSLMPEWFIGLVGLETRLSLTFISSPPQRVNLSYPSIHLALSSLHPSISLSQLPNRARAIAREQGGGWWRGNWFKQWKEMEWASQVSSTAVDLIPGQLWSKSFAFVLGYWNGISYFGIWNAQIES